MVRSFKIKYTDPSFLDLSSLVEIRKLDTEQRWRLNFMCINQKKKIKKGPSTRPFNHAAQKDNVSQIFLDNHRTSVGDYHQQISIHILRY